MFIHSLGPLLGLCNSWVFSQFQYGSQELNIDPILRHCFQSWHGLSKPEKQIISILLMRDYPEPPIYYASRLSQKNSLGSKHNKRLKKGKRVIRSYIASNCSKILLIRYV